VTGPPTALSVIGAVAPVRREILPGDTVRVPADAPADVTASGGTGQSDAGAPGVGPGALGLVASLMTAWSPSVPVGTGCGDRFCPGSRGTGPDGAPAA